MKTFKWKDDAARDRIDEVRRRLIAMGYRCLASGPFGLPSYDQVQAWSGPGGRLIYLVYGADASWDLVAPLDESNDTELALEAAARRAEAGRTPRPAAARA